MANTIITQEALGRFGPQFLRELKRIRRNRLLAKLFWAFTYSFFLIFFSAYMKASIDRRALGFALFFGLFVVTFFTIGFRRLRFVEKIRRARIRIIVSLTKQTVPHYRLIVAEAAKVHPCILHEHSNGLIEPELIDLLGFIPLPINRWLRRFSEISDMDDLIERADLAIRYLENKRLLKSFDPQALPAQLNSPPLEFANIAYSLICLFESIRDCAKISLDIKAVNFSIRDLETPEFENVYELIQAMLLYAKKSAELKRALEYTESTKTINPKVAAIVLSRTGDASETLAALTANDMRILMQGILYWFYLPPWQNKPVAQTMNYLCDDGPQFSIQLSFEPRQYLTLTRQ